MSLGIRSYDLADQAAVEAFFDVTWREDAISPFDPVKVHGDLRRIPEEYQTNGGGFWLLCRQQVIGTIGIRRLTHEIAELKRLNVLSDYRGRGLGERLFRYALLHAREQGVGSVRLDTVRRPGPAMQLFEKYGFREIGRYNSNPDADVFLELQFDKTGDGQHAPTARPRDSGKQIFERFPS